MKAISLLRVGVYCAIIVALHSILLGIVEREGTVEKLMAQTYGFGEVLLIVAFVFFRLATYLIVPPLLAGFAVSRWLSFRRA